MVCRDGAAMVVPSGDTGATCRRTAVRPDGPRTPPAGGSNPTEIVPVLGDHPEVELGQLP